MAQPNSRDPLETVARELSDISRTRRMELAAQASLSLPTLYNLSRPERRVKVDYATLKVVLEVLGYRMVVVKTNLSAKLQGGTPANQTNERS